MCLRDSYVIQANGNVIKEETSTFFRQRQFTLQPGDTIVVPIEIKLSDNIKVATDLTQIIYQMAVAAAAVQSFLSKKRIIDKPEARKKEYNLNIKEV